MAEPGVAPNKLVAVEDIARIYRTRRRWALHSRGRDRNLLRPAGLFLKAYYDPFVNFSGQTMVRLGAGLKF